ncbi:MAG TPA: helix-turn-helix domain-containing protein [Vicinamibacterales bacterium]|nr:helix-turn-helix domain-containing protein [Vicinamibacterales bacterium]
MFRALKASKARHAQLIVLLALASFADEQGLCYPSLRAISKRARLTRQTVIDSIRALVQAGELAMLSRGHVDRDRVKDRRRRGGFQPTHYYQLRVVCWVDHLGGQNLRSKVVKSSDSRSSSYKSLNQSARQRRAAVSSEGLLTLYVAHVESCLEKDPELGGEPLLDAASDDIRRRSWSRGVCDLELLGEAIEIALKSRSSSTQTRATA